jgi:hypothetical protein
MRAWITDATPCGPDLPIIAQYTTQDVGELREVGGVRLRMLGKLLTEKRAAIALADFMSESGLLDQFKDVDQEAMGTTE